MLFSLFYRRAFAFDDSVKNVFRLVVFPHNGSVKLSEFAFHGKSRTAKTNLDFDRFALIRRPNTVMRFVTRGGRICSRSIEIEGFENILLIKLSDKTDDAVRLKSHPFAVRLFIVSDFR